MSNNNNSMTDWEPMAGWLMLIPVKLPDKTEGGIVLPETYTIKSTSGICFKAGHDMDKDLIGQEVFFPRHEEYQIIDSDTDKLFYIVPLDKVILHRQPVAQPEFLRVGDQGTGAPRAFQRSS
jgi:hypothetical protein